MTHQDRIGHGTRIFRSADRTKFGTRTTVGRVRDVTPPAVTRDTPETTDMESPDAWREYIGGGKDAGELSFGITFDPSSAETTTFMNDLNDDEANYYFIVFPDGAEWGFLALLTGFEPGVPVLDKMTGTVTYKLSGKPGWIA